MKKLLLIFMVLMSFIPFGCSDDDKPEEEPTPVIAVNGKWKYDSNLTTGACDDLLTSTIEIKNGEAIYLTVPNSVYGFKAGEKSLQNIKQTTSANNFSANGVARSSNGTVADPNVVVDIIVQSGGQEMTLEYKSSVCNPKQKWVKIP